MIILGLDPARHCGYALGDGKRLVTGVWDLARGADDHPGSQLVRLEQLLTRAIIENVVDLVAYEEASFGSPNPAVQAAHNEKAGTIKLACAKAGVRCKGLNIATIKKFFTGSGRATKPQMIRAARTFLNLVTVSDDEADAAAVLTLAQREATGIMAAAITPTKAKRRKTKRSENRLF